jgi:3-hydroxybutyrate dehydrogenase
MSGLLDGKVAIVTGAAKGLGHAIAHKLSDAGATVVLSDLDEAAVSSAAAGLAGCTSAVCDVRDEAQVQKRRYRSSLRTRSPRTATST